MARYQNLLFDLDDTLLDYGAAEDHSLRTLFEEYDLQLTPEVKRTFQDYNVKMWQRYERGELDWQAMQVHLFGDYFKVYHQLKVDGRQVIEHYLDLLAGNHQLVPGTRTIMPYLKKQGYSIYAVTNGQARVQRARMKDAHLRQYFDGVFISEIVGAQKPSKEMFDIVLDEIGGSPANTVMIGDSLSSDIQGGVNAHLDTGWYNPYGKRNTTRLKPTFEFHALRELQSIL